MYEEQLFTESIVQDNKPQYGFHWHGRLWFLFLLPFFSVTWFDSVTANLCLGNRSLKIWAGKHQHGNVTEAWNNARWMMYARFGLLISEVARKKHVLFCFYPDILWNKNIKTNPKKHQNFIFLPFNSCTSATNWFLFLWNTGNIVQGRKKK